jgi:hypothetical protein
MQVKAYKAAEDIYLHGKHVDGHEMNGGSLSLSHLATTSERTIVPQFDAFKRYYGTDGFTDTIIREALDGSDGSSESERRVKVVRSAQVSVMYFGVLQAANEAVSECNNGVSTPTVGSSEVGESWDKAAAMLIGHLEGTESGGSEGGYLYYDLAQEYCREFGTCTADITDVEVNDELISLLYSGRGAILGNSCSGLRKAANELASLILVPVIQATLSSSLEISGKNSGVKATAEAFVYSRHLLPLVDDANRDAADTIDSNLGLPGPGRTNWVASEVFNAFSKVYTRLGVDCTMVGIAQGFDACTGVHQNSSSTIWIIIGVSVGVLVAVCCFYLYRRRRSKREDLEKLPENNPTFVTADGELNHSMDLLQKAFSTSSKPPINRAEMEGLNDASAPDDDDFEDRPSPDII